MPVDIVKPDRKQQETVPSENQTYDIVTMLHVSGHQGNTKKLVLSDQQSKIKIYHVSIK